jgi:conjugal transfer pilus assembly protein TraD
MSASVNSDSLFLGWGNTWGHNEAQLIYDLLKRDVDSIVGKQRVEKGQGYIHGVLEQEKDIRYKLKWADGHTLITGATGSGKTRFFDLVLKQLILRNESVIFIDPKGDKEIRRIAKETCELMDEPERYVQWHPAFPRDSIRLNPLKNFSRSSEIAARVTGLIPEDGDSFYRDLCNTVVQYIVDAMHMLNEQVTLTKIRFYFEHFGKLIEKAIIAHCDANKIDWKTRYFTRLEGLSDEEQRAMLMIQFYRSKVEHEHPEQTISSMCTQYVEKRRMLEQSTGSLMANLQKVTSNEFEELLSPFDPNDKRIITDMTSIIKTNKCMIIGTDSMADRMVSTATCKMILADAAAVAANRYNYGDDSDKVINLIVDEASEVLCSPLLQMLNKARGAKFRLWVATQTISDFTAELGSEAKADQIIANTNNFISFRCADTPTQERVCAKNPTTRVRYVMRTQGFNAKNDDVDGLGANIGERLMEEEAELFPMQLMGQLPDLEYVASLAGGKLIKGRIPILRRAA